MPGPSSRFIRTILWLSTSIEIGSPPEADLDCVGMIITNDLGFVPKDGYTDFMIWRFRGKTRDQRSKT